jgi:hypothetical protein
LLKTQKSFNNYGKYNKFVFCAWQFILILILLFFGFISPVYAVNVTLQWIPNREPDLAGYRVFSREEGQSYDYTNPSLEVAEATCRINNLDEGKTYCFVVRAFNTKGFESNNSNEACLEAAATPSNQPPTAIIAKTHIEAVSGTTVTLDGSKSADADDGIASYHWSQVDGPSVNLSDHNLNVATFTAPETDQYGSNLTFRLTLTDFGGLQSTADCSVYVTPGNEPATLILNVNFDQNNDGFSYVDDAFRNTSQFGYADGVWTDSGGFAGGALKITLGGIDNKAISDMSGGWQRDFDLSSPAKVALSFRYKLTQTPEYENDELSQVLVSVDHILYGQTPNDYVVQIRGNGNGGSSENTGWQLFEIDLGILDAGDHTLIIGGYNNKKTYKNESTEVLIDDVVIKSLGTNNQAPNVDAGSDQTIILPADDTKLSANDDIQVTVSEEPINIAPVVNAGSDQAITLPVDKVLLKSSVTDDGLPTGILNTVWTQLSGPADQVVFENAYAIQTTVTFLSAGTYVLRLSADDGKLAADDDVTVNVTKAVSGSPSTCILDSQFQQTILADNIIYYTDRDYRLTSIPSKYIGMDMIQTPNDDRDLHTASDYLTFKMPYDGMVYVAFDSRTTSLPGWMSGFSNTGDRIYTSLSSQPYLTVYQKSYSQSDCVNFGANKAPGFSGGVVSNYIVFR